MLILRPTTRSRRTSIVTGHVAYDIGAGLAWVSQIGAFICYGAIACYFVFPHAVRSRPFRRGTGQ